MRIEIPGAPIALQRARTKGNVFYDPQYTAKQNIIWYFKRTYGEVTPLETPIELEITFYMPIPKSWSKKKQAASLG
ncbi:MAG: RusA family crossover junction endodeoxyribonuclease, partial [Candidatus Heimdallarchaeaceae archaeon]